MGFQTGQFVHTECWPAHLVTITAIIAAIVADIKTVKTGTRISLSLELADGRIMGESVGGESVCNINETVHLSVFKQ